MDTPSRPRVGISSCLLGQRVRYDGGHKRDSFITDVLGRFVVWVPVCPEVEIGLGVPRPALHLEQSDDGPSLVVTESGADLTQAMERFSSAAIGRFHRERLDGYVLKSRSPSCALDDASVLRSGTAVSSAPGKFAVALTRAMPTLPVEDEVGVEHGARRDGFLEAVFARRRWREAAASARSPHEVARFHSRHELVLLARDRHSHARAADLIAKRDEVALHALVDAYGEVFLSALAAKPSRRSHADVLAALAARVSEHVDARGCNDIAEAIAGYRAGRLGRHVPMALLRACFDDRDERSAPALAYLEPYPAELAATPA